MTALEIAMAGYLAFGQPTGNYYEAITKHAGLQVIHSNGAVTLRLAEVGREESAADGAKTIVVRLKDERYPFEVTRYIKRWGEAVVLIRPRAAARPRPIKIRAETVRHGKYAPASGELVFTPGTSGVKVISHGTSGLANDARLCQVEAQQREFEAKE